MFFFLQIRKKELYQISVPLAFVLLTKINERILNLCLGSAALVGAWEGNNLVWADPRARFRFNEFILYQLFPLLCVLADSDDSENEGGLGNVSRVVMRPAGHSGKAKRGHLCFDASFETGKIFSLTLFALQPESIKSGAASRSGAAAAFKFSFRINSLTRSRARGPLLMRLHMARVDYRPTSA